MAKFASKDTYDPFANGNGTTTAEVDAELYGAVDLPTGGAPVVARRLAIASIVPDMAQPRRAIPRAVRGHWNGNPDGLAVVLEAWREAALNEFALTHGGELPVEAIISGRGEGSDIAGEFAPVADEYIELLRLASDIRANGLTNPITVSRYGDRYTIETGERRWLAHQLLYHYEGDKWATIPAREVTRDVWRQASENNARRPLNAIGMARQLALLIMSMYEGDSGVFFDSYHTLVLPGESDQRYYAQVANGNIYRIKRGYGEKVQTAMGLKSRAQISQYRALLSIPSEVWVEADEGNYSEHKIRDTLTTVNVTTPEPATDGARVEPINTPDMLTAVNVAAPEPSQNGRVYDPYGAEVAVVEPDEGKRGEYAPRQRHEPVMPVVERVRASEAERVSDRFVIVADMLVSLHSESRGVVKQVAADLYGLTVDEARVKAQERDEFGRWLQQCYEVLRNELDEQLSAFFNELLDMSDG